MCFTVPSARQLLEALAPVGSYLLHCGTIWVHGSAVGGARHRGRGEAAPSAITGCRKRRSRSSCSVRARRGTVRGTVLQPGHIVGPGWAPVNPAGNSNLDVFNRLARGDELALPNFGLETVHHVHADDVAQGFARALSNPAAASGQAFHVVSGRALTLRGYAESVAAWFGQTARLSFQPWEAWAGGLGAPGCPGHVGPHCPQPLDEHRQGHRRRWATSPATAPWRRSSSRWPGWWTTARWTGRPPASPRHLSRPGALAVVVHGGGVRQALLSQADRTATRRSPRATACAAGRSCPVRPGWPRRG